MEATLHHHPNRQNSGGLLLALVFCGGLLVALATATLFKGSSEGSEQESSSSVGTDTLSIPGAGEVVLNSEHPFERHAADDVNRVRRCLQNGVNLTFREKVGGEARFHLLCQEPDTQSWMDMIVQKIGDRYEEITSFLVKDGTTNWSDVAGWLSRKGATRFTQPLP